MQRRSVDQSRVRRSLEVVANPTPADNLDMSEAPNWNQRTTLIDVQFEWEDSPTARPVRLISTSPKDGDPVRVSMGGAELEAVIDRFAGGVLHVRLAKAKMQKAVGRPSVRRKATR